MVGLALRPEPRPKARRPPTRFDARGDEPRQTEFDLQGQHFAGTKPLHQAYLPRVSLSRVNELRRKTVPAQLVLLGALALVLLPAYFAWVLSARIARAPGLQLPRRQAVVVIFAAVLVTLGSALFLDSQLD